MTVVPLGSLIAPAASIRAGARKLPILSMTMHGGLIEQSSKFKKRIASEDTTTYKVAERGQLVVGFPIDEGVLDFQLLYDEAIVSPAYGIWDVRDRDIVDPSYLSRYLRSPGALSFYRSKLRSTTARRRTLPAQLFLQLPVHLPPLDEQRRIAAVLDHVNRLVSRSRAIQIQSQSLQPALFRDMFGQHPWPTRKLGELLDFLTSGSRGWARHYASAGELFLRIQNVRDGRLDLADIAYVTVPESAEARRTRVQPGDVLLSITADLGRVAVVPPSIKSAYINQHLSILRSSAVSSDFLAAYLASPAGQAQIHRRNRGGVKAGLNFDDIKSFEIPLPPKTLQDAFSQRLAGTEAERQRHAQRAALLQQLRAGLQAQAFSGKL